MKREIIVGYLLGCILALAVSLTFQQASGAGLRSTVFYFSSSASSHPPAPDLDTDGDGLSDSWERANGLDPFDAGDARFDVDGDGVTSAVEYRLGTDPWMADTDGDGVSDGEELAHGLLADSCMDGDGDGLPDDWEAVRLGGGASDGFADADGDGCANGAEFLGGTFPRLANVAVPANGGSLTVYRPVSGGGG